MLYLVTGANGAGKTLHALQWVRERSLKESRPVCHNGRFEPICGGELDGWKKIDFKHWQDEADGTIFFVDECHNDLPTRSPSSTPPDHVRMLAEHRRRGFDFYLITQHPQNIDAFVRRLVGSPGWHRHIKRSFGADMVSVLEWSAVNPNCEKSGSGKSGSLSMHAFPKHVYAWYRSASMHTGKRKIPAALWLLAACLVLVPLLVYLAIPGAQDKARQAKPAPAAAAAQQTAPLPSVAQARRTLTADEYIVERSARLKDFAHTAPAYEQVTTPLQAPYPAACIHMGKTCKCYSQQATLLQVSGQVCLQIVQQGFFVDWQQVKDRGEDVRPSHGNWAAKAARDEARGPTPPADPRTVLPTPAARPHPAPNHYSQRLAARNAQVRSNLVE